MPLISLDKPRPAIVTGASRGLGKAIASALAELGCPVVINFARSQDAADELAESIRRSGGQALAIRADLTDLAAIDRLAAEARSAFGPIGILVNNAGIATRREVFSNTVESFDETVAANVRSAYALTQKVIPDMRDLGWGRIVFLSSTAAMTGGVMSAPYAGSKAALEGMMHHYAAYLATYGITANAVAPAFIATEMMTGGAVPDHMPLKRFGAAAEVAMVVQLMICCGYLTGQTVQVNGGVYMT